MKEGWNVAPTSRRGRVMVVVVAVATAALTLSRTTPAPGFALDRVQMATRAAGRRLPLVPAPTVVAWFAARHVRAEVVGRHPGTWCGIRLVDRVLIDTRCRNGAVMVHELAHVRAGEGHGARFVAEMLSLARTEVGWRCYRALAEELARYGVTTTVASSKTHHLPHAPPSRSKPS